MADDSLPEICLYFIGREEARAAGLRRYFVGEKCKRGHLSERRVSTGRCIECLNENKNQPYHRLSKDILARRRQRHAANPERIREMDRRRHAANPHTKRRADRRRYLKHKQKRYQSALRWRAKNQEQFRELCRRDTRRYRARHPERVRESEHKRRALESAANGSFTAADIVNIRKLQRNRCARCRESLKDKKVHIDHIMPLALGGSNDRTNIQLLCAHCNISKGARDPIEDARRIGRLL